MWAAPDLRPCPVMVWLPAHTGQFLDYIDGRAAVRRCSAWPPTAGCAATRSLGLAWAEVDLDEGVAYVRETGSGDGPKSEAGVRVVPLPAPVRQALRAWRKQQAADQLAWGRDWPDTGLVFTREDGSPVPGQWISARFEILAYRCRAAADQVPRPAPRSGGPLKAAGSTPRSSPPCSATRRTLVHRCDVRARVPGGREGRRRGRRGDRPACRSGLTSNGAPPWPRSYPEGRSSPAEFEEICGRDGRG